MAKAGSPLSLESIVQTQKFDQFKKIEKESFDRLILIISAEQAKNLTKLSNLVPAPLLKRLLDATRKRTEPLKASQQLVVLGEVDLQIAVLPEDRTAFDLLGFYKQVLKTGLSTETLELAIAFLDSKLTEDAQENLGAALGTRTFLMPEYGQRLKDQKKFSLKKCVIFSSKPSIKAIQYGIATSYGTNLVRSLGFTPPNFLNSKTYGDRIRKIAQDAKLQLKFHSNAELKKMGAGAFTAVDQGDPQSSGGIYELSYSPSSSKSKAPVALVGKGLCYDTGGYDIKTGGYMVNMKGDMQGSAVALAGLVVASKLKWPLKMKAYLGVTENHISPKAYKADDVVTALNGVSIEVINTDAEGRMVLADTLALASRAKPSMIMDFATLTGMAMYAIGQSYGAAFTNRENLHSPIVKAGKTSGERVWTFPLDKDYGKALESQVADTIQCTKGRSPDHILAAFFLNRFVEKEIPWVHLDLSAAEKEGGLGHVDSLFTGFGVRFALEFIRTQYKL